MDIKLESIRRPMNSKRMCEDDWPGPGGPARVRGSRTRLTAEVLLLFAVFPPLGGCVSYSAFKDARALDPGAFRLDVAPGATVVRPRSGLVAYERQYELPRVGDLANAYFAFELQARYGIARGLDLGLKTGGTNLELNSTLQLVRRETFDVALAPALQYALGTNGDDEGWEMFLVKLPVLIDFRFGPGGDHALVFGPTIAQAIGSGNGRNSNYKPDALFIAGTVGFSFKVGVARFVPEIALYTPLTGGAVALPGSTLRVSPDLGVGKPVIVQAGLAFSFGK